MTSRKQALLTFAGIWAVAYTVGNVVAGVSVIAPPSEILLTTLVFPASGVLFVVEHVKLDFPGFTGFVGHVLFLLMFGVAFIRTSERAYAGITCLNLVLAVSCIIGYKDTVEDFFTALYF